MIDEKELAREIVRIAGSDPKKCMKCGKCSASCPSYDRMEYHPHQFVSMIAEGTVALLLASESIYACLSCMACVERCPRGVEPGRLVEAVRLCALREKGKDHLSANAVFDPDLPIQALVTANRKYRK